MTSKAVNEAKEAHIMLEFIELEESKSEMLVNFGETECCVKKKRKHSVVDSIIDSPFMGQKPKREKIEEEASQIALAEDMLFIIQDLQILASNNFRNKFLDVHLLLKSFMKLIPSKSSIYRFI
jgi:hypothetical protein